MRVLVCGGRDFDEKEAAYEVLNRLENVELVINGGAEGADQLSSDWARDYRIPSVVYPAEFDKFGEAAGPIRNIRMVEECQPDLVVSFPGDDGTDNMKEVARKHEIPIWDIIITEEGMDEVDHEE